MFTHKKAINNSVASTLRYLAYHH